MQITRITIQLSIHEREALRILAQLELRDPRDQVRFLVRQELVRRGLLSKEARPICGEDIPEVDHVAYGND